MPVEGLPLQEAARRLEAAGYRVDRVETRGPKPWAGNEMRVLRARESGPGRVELIYAPFKTDLFWRPGE